MDSTDGLSRGYEVVGTGNPIQMPIGADVYGRLFNVIGDAIDGLGKLPKQEKTECQFTVKHPNSKIYQLHLKFYSQVLK
jgi:F0F1-type ATP synthase beta subunit